MAGLAHEIECSEITIESKNRLHDWMLIRLRPSGRVDGKDQKLAFGDDRRQGMQKLHPGWQGSCVGDKSDVQGSRNAEGNGKPESRTRDDQQRTPWSEGSACSENPRHSAFECVMYGFFENLVADLASQQRPMLAHGRAPGIALAGINRQAFHQPFE